MKHDEYLAVGTIIYTQERNWTVVPREDAVQSFRNGASTNLLQQQKQRRLERKRRRKWDIEG